MNIKIPKISKQIYTDDVLNILENKFLNQWSYRMLYQMNQYRIKKNVNYQYVSANTKLYYYI